MGDTDPKVRFANVLVLQDLVGIEGQKKVNLALKEICEHRKSQTISF